MTKKEAMAVQDAMDKLALALVAHEHFWTCDERRQYNRAQRILCRETERPRWDRSKS